MSKNLYSQKSFFNYEPFKIDKLWLIEKPFEGKEFASPYKTAFLNSTTDYEQPKNFDRPKNTDFGAVRVQYFYSKKDSIVRLITYSWDVKKATGKSTFFKTYNAQFDKISDSISKDIGAPKSNEAKIEKMKGDIFKGCYQRKMEWETEKYYVITTLVWSENKIFVAFNTSIHFKQ